MKKARLEDILKKDEKDFIEKLVHQAHADPEIRKILDIENETPGQTFGRILKSVRIRK